MWLAERSMEGLRKRLGSVLKIGRDKLAGKQKGRLSRGALLKT